MTILFPPTRKLQAVTGWLAATVAQRLGAIVTMFWPPPRQPQAALERLVTVCVQCASLCVQVAPDVFEHLNDVCRECFGTTGRCEYRQWHGMHEYRPRGSQQRVLCLQAQASQCSYCHRALDAQEAICPDHFHPCCGCCEPR